jgi:hypothetical protein
MSKFTIGVFLLITFLAEAQIGAKAQQQTGIYGIWSNNQFGYQMTLLLSPDGSGEFDGDPIKYSVAGSMLSITTAVQTTKYSFSLQGNVLTVTGGDIEGSIVFMRQGSGTGNVSVQTDPVSTTPGVQPGNEVGNNSAESIMGVWSGNGETIEFGKGGQCQYMGQTMGYQVSGNSIFLQTTQGQVSLAYSLNGNQLTLSGNGLHYTYTRSAANATGGNSSAGVSTDKGRVAHELIGKWCWTNVTSTNSGGTTSEQCITLHADGTYQYVAERSSSVSTNAYSGGTNSQSNDQGTWSFDGGRIYYTSRMGNGSGSYVLEKRNHPKTGDPMIILDGEPYVSFYQKSPW